MESRTKLKGNSGAKLLMVKGVVYKTLNKPSPEVLKRFHESFMMQKNFKHDVLNTPKVLSFDKENATLAMEYIEGENPLCTPNFLLWAFMAVDFIKSNVKESVMSLYDPIIFQSKIESVVKAIYANKNMFPLRKQLKEPVEKLIKQFSSYIEIPSGYCHGDFTFNNMIASEKSLYTFDFLPSFINSPILDICKLRQDTQFKWIKCFHNVSDPRLLTIDQELHNCFKDYTFYKEHYEKFQALNLLRIVPYCTEKDKLEIAFRGFIKCTHSS